MISRTDRGDRNLEPVEVLQAGQAMDSPLADEYRRSIAFPDDSRLATLEIMRSGTLPNCELSDCNKVQGEKISQHQRRADVTNNSFPELVDWAKTTPAVSSIQVEAATRPKVNVVLVDNLAFPGKLKANKDSGLYDEAFDFRHGRDLPEMMRSLSSKYPNAVFDITVDTHGNHGRPEGYKLVQPNGKNEYVKYGALEEALYSAGIKEDSVRIFYGGCNAATGYFNAKLSETAKRYAAVTWGARSANSYENHQPSTDFIRLLVKDPWYGLLRDIKTARIDETDEHSHDIPQKKIDELIEIARKYRRTDPATFEDRVRKLAGTIQYPNEYMNPEIERTKPRLNRNKLAQPYWGRPAYQRPITPVPLFPYR